MSEQDDEHSARLLELARDPAMRAGKFKQVGGAQNDILNNQILQQTWDATPVRKPEDADAVYRQFANTMAALAGIDPQDPLEGMLAAQIVAGHNAAMDCFRRAADPRLSPELRQDALNMANKLARTWTMQIETLNRHRGKGQQKVTVEHVHVHEGGQAVVGNVELASRRPGAPPGREGANQPFKRPRTGGTRKAKEQPHAKRLEPTTHAPEPALRGKDPERDPVSRAGNAERALPHARRKIPRGA